MFIEEGRVPVVIRPEYTMYLEYWMGDLWFHVDVHISTVPAFRKGIEDAKILTEMSGNRIKAFVDNDKLEKFCKMCGWVKVDEGTTKYGTIVPVYAANKLNGVV